MLSQEYISFINNKLGKSFYKGNVKYEDYFNCDKINELEKNDLQEIMSEQFNIYVNNKFPHLINDKVDIII